MTPARNSGLRYRRPRNLAGSWQCDGFRLSPVGSLEPVAVTPEEFEILAACDEWASVDDIAARVGDRSPEAVGAGVRRLAESGLLLRSDEDPDPLDHGLTEWRSWVPHAAAYHFGTRGVAFVNPLERVKPLLVIRDEPSPLKSVAGDERVELPPFRREGPLRRALRARRTARRWADGTLRQEDLADLCGLTWGTQHWGLVDDVPPQQLKTSPSGGARHSIEAYVGVLDVEGMTPGLYHYHPDRHDLTKLEGVFDRDLAAAYLGGQDHFAGAAVVVFMTSVVERVLWRYDHPRSYRQIWIEAGHLAQTFLTLATDLGLACFSTKAFDDEVAEAALGVDGVREILLYAVGAGSAPRSDGWKPLPDDRQVTRLRPPSYHERFGWNHEPRVD